MHTVLSKDPLKIFFWLVSWLKQYIVLLQIQVDLQDHQVHLDNLLDQWVPKFVILIYTTCM